MHKLVVFVGGAADRRTRVMHRVFERARLPGAEKSYFSWHQGEHLAYCLSQIWSRQTVILIGHSWGAVTALRQAMRSPRKIELLITLDPVAWVRPKGQPAMPWLNVYVPIREKLANRNNLIAWLGNHWGHTALADHNVCLHGADHGCVGAMLNRVQGQLQAALQPSCDDSVVPLIGRR